MTQKKETVLKRNDPICKTILESAHLTDSPLWELWKKQLCVQQINEALDNADFIDYPFGSAVGCEFRVYVSESPTKKGTWVFNEFLIVHFRGGIWGARCANFNSNAANFKEIGRMLTGDCYEEVGDVEELEKTAYRLILKHNGGLELRLPSSDHEEGK